MSLKVAPNPIRTAKWIALSSVALMAFGSALSGCSSDSSTPVTPSSGGAVGSSGGNTANPSKGGTATTTAVGGTAHTTGNGGVTAAGGTTQTTGSGGDTAMGGAVGAGGAATGGAATTQGGAATGGAVSKGGTTSGGAAAGGAATAGATNRGGTNGGGAAAGGAGNAGGSTHTGVWKVMPLGDSITGTTCYPQLLSQTLKTAGHTNFQFVGTSLNNQSCNGAPSLQTEGHGGYLVTYLTTDSPPQSGKGTLAELKTWAAEKPEVVLMHFGTNDCWSSVATASIMSAYVTVLAEFRSQNPAVIFFVSKIIPLNPSGCSSCASNVTSLDAAITTSWASTNSTATSPVYIIDNWTGFDTTTDTADGCHPNVAGAQKMATVTSNALIAKNLSGL